MVVNDPIADMLTRIRNAQIAKHDAVVLPASNTKIVLKYVNGKQQPVIAGLKRISKPGLRVYAKSEELPKVLGGLGIAIISTSKGLMTDREARKQMIGGEVLAYIW